MELSHSSQYGKLKTMGARGSIRSSHTSRKSIKGRASILNSLGANLSSEMSLDGQMVQLDSK